ncbi:hypothetical protein IGI57_002568 [Enterococcus sp. DIV0213j]|uniref:DnaD domain-containing protein n=1 Tax=Enterococcus sp. DIV0213j TaxID=2774649 RepID=UPI003D2A63B4
MDYIRQLNAFDNWLEYNELGAGPQLLWYKLMAIANKSGWQSELSIANTRLQAMTKTSEKTLINNRNQLIQNGLLQYKKRGRTKAGVYILSDLTGNFTVKTTVDSPVEPPTTGNIPVNSKVNPKVNREVNPSVDSTVNPSAYINNTKQNNTINNNDHDIGVFEFIQQSWGKPPTGILQGALGSFIQSWGSEMILFAFQLAYENGVEMHGLKKYVVTILNSWTQKGIDTLEKAKRDQENFKQQKKTNYTKQKNIRREKLPSWVDKPVEDVPLEPEKQAEISRRFEEYQKRKMEEAENGD